MSQSPFRPGQFRYDRDVAAHYSAARALPPETLDTWERALEPYFKSPQAPLVLDLGCGTGRFTGIFGKRFNATVVGLDASTHMIDSARKTIRPTNVTYAVGRAEALPLADSTCDVVWLSQVIHHVSDRRACAEQCRRVLREGGHAFVRGAFGDRTEGYSTFLGFFPGARRALSGFPTLSSVAADFKSAGFRIQALDVVRQVACRSLTELAARTKLRVDSTLRSLPDREFKACQAELERAAACEDTPDPVIEMIDLLVLR
jgi:SAM-dependent methyltransferase